MRYYFLLDSKGWIGYMPPVEDLENPNYKFATEIFSEDGKVLGTYSYSKENRVFVGYNDLSPISSMLIATEDVRFAEHSVLTPSRCSRAVVKSPDAEECRRRRHQPAAFQAALFSSADNIMERLFQKPIEWVIAVKLERYYTKEEILTMYLNSSTSEQCGRYKNRRLYLLRLRAERIKDRGSRHAGGYVQESVALQSGTL